MANWGKYLQQYDKAALEEEAGANRVFPEPEQ